MYGMTEMVTALLQHPGGVDVNVLSAEGEHCYVVACELNHWQCTHWAPTGPYPLGALPLDEVVRILLGSAALLDPAVVRQGHDLALHLGHSTSAGVIELLWLGMPLLGLDCAGQPLTNASAAAAQLGIGI